MKKVYVIFLAVLVGLSGCICKRDKKTKKKKANNKKVEVMDQVNVPVAGDEITSYFDDKGVNLGEFVLVEDEEVQVAAGSDSATIDSTIDMTDESFVEKEYVKLDEEQEISLDDFSWVQEMENEENKFESVYFEFDKFDITEEQQAIIEKDIEVAKKILAEGGDPKVILEGNACKSAGSEVYNLVLSEKRAKVVADRFVAAGIDRDNIKVVARGDSNPSLDDKGNPVGGNRDEQWRNRRTEVKIIYN